MEVWRSGVVLTCVVTADWRQWEGRQAGPTSHIFRGWRITRPSPVSVRSGLLPPPGQLAPTLASHWSSPLTLSRHWWRPAVDLPPSAGDQEVAPL